MVFLVDSGDRLDLVSESFRLVILEAVPFCTGVAVVDLETLCFSAIDGVLFTFLFTFDC